MGEAIGPDEGRDHVRRQTAVAASGERSLSTADSRRSRRPLLPSDWPGGDVASSRHDIGVESTGGSGATGWVTRPAEVNDD